MIKAEQPELEGWSLEEQAELDRLMKKRLAVQREGKSGYDLKLQFLSDESYGSEGERILAEALTTAEVKRVRTAGSDSGTNYKKVFVEFENRGKPSGLSVTEADYWAYVLGGDQYEDEVMVLIKTDRLKKICERYEFSDPAGDGKKSIGKRVKIMDLFRRNKEL